MKSLRIKDLPMKCCNYIEGIVKDNSKFQGYESRTGDFDICIDCLIALKDKVPFAELQPFKKKQFAHRLFPETLPMPDKFKKEYKDKAHDSA